jgi:hypothetical protein
LKAALQAPQKFRTAIPQKKVFPLVWDTGASLCLSHDKKDFIGPITPVEPDQLKLSGISEQLNISGIGQVSWAILDDAGLIRILTLPCLYVPSAKMRLLSVSSLLQHYEGEEVSVTSNHLSLSGLEGDKDRRPVQVYINKNNNLPMSYAFTPEGVSDGISAFEATITSVHQANINLSPAHKELLRWHQRFGHIGFRRLQLLMRMGALATSQAQRKLHESCSKLREFPLCAACQFGKQRLKSAPGIHHSHVQDHVAELSEDNLFPGQKVSVDHFISSSKGRLFSGTGRNSSSSKLSGGAIFVDHASNYVQVEFQSHLTTHETLDSKIKFEQTCRDFGVVVQHYHSDNGSAFTSKAYSDHLREFAQIFTFAGVGAHHHNGKAERSIQTIMSMARTMMLHAAIHWPDMVDDVSMWPMAVQYAVHIYNHIPNPSSGLSPADIFTRQHIPLSKLHNLHVWGCPAYVLEKAIQDEKNSHVGVQGLRDVSLLVSVHHILLLLLVS